MPFTEKTQGLGRTRRRHAPAEHDGEVRDRIEWRYSYQEYPFADVAAILTATGVRPPRKSWSGVGACKTVKRLGIKPRRIFMSDQPEERWELVREWRDKRCPNYIKQVERQ